MSNSTFSNKLTQISTTIADCFDVFGQLPTFRVLKKSKYTSSVGCFLTIILIVVITSYLISEIIQMLQKSQPSMIASETLIYDTTAFKLKNENFTLALSVADFNNNAMEGLNKYYTMEIKQCSRKRIEDNQSGNITIQTECTNIPFETCNKTHFTTELQKTYFSKIKLGTMQCINRKFLNETPPILKGQLNAMDFHFLQILLKFCKNTTEMTTCASPEEITTKLQSAQYVIYSSDYLLQLSRANDPLEQIITAQFSSFSATTSKKLVQYYEIVETIQDDGLIFESTSTQANLKKGQSEPYQELYNGQYLINHYITITSVQTNYFRSYIKIQTILAKIGGIWQIILMAFQFLFRGLIYDLMLLKVSNKLFQLQDKKNSNLSMSPCKKQQQQQSNSGIQQYFSFLDQIKIIFGLDNVISPQFLKAKKAIMKKLDIVRIIKKLQRLEILSSLLLNDKQYQALITISKLQIDSDNKVNSVRKKSSHEALIQLYNNIKESRNFGLEGEINNKLLQQRIHFSSMVNFIKKKNNKQLNNIYILDLPSPINLVSQDKIIEIRDDIQNLKLKKLND